MGFFPWARAGWLALACSLCVHAAVTAAATPQPQRTDLITDMPAAGDLAAPTNGQTLYVLDEASGEVMAIDPFDPAAKRWTAVSAGPRTDAGTDTLAISCIDTSMLAMLCRSRDGWSLQTHRLQPGTAADPAKPAQTVVIGRANEAAAATAAGARAPGDDRACLAISPSRDWLGVCGLPAPLPAVMRAPIAGARIGGVTARACPVLPADMRPTAATISMAEEFVLFATDRAGVQPAAGSVFVSFYLPPDPRRLLHLDTSLPRVLDAAFCRADGTLWVVGGGPRGEAGSASAAVAPEGLWRIDAVMRKGRQSAEAVCVARLEAARAVVCLSERAIIVTHGRETRTVSRIDPTQPASTP